MDDDKRVPLFLLLNVEGLNLELGVELVWFFSPSVLLPPEELLP